MTKILGKLGPLTPEQEILLAENGTNGMNGTTEIAPPSVSVPADYTKPNMAMDFINKNKWYIIAVAIILIVVVFQYRKK